MKVWAQRKRLNDIDGHSTQKIGNIYVVVKINYCGGQHHSEDEYRCLFSFFFTGFYFS